MLSGIDIRNTKRLTTLAIGLICVGLLVGGISLRHSKQRPDVSENGMGGPAEPALAVGALGFLPEAAGTLPDDRYLPTLAGSFVTTQLALMPTEGPGPISQSATAPKDMVIAPGQTFYEALAARGVPHNDIMALVKACGDFRNLRNVRSGEIFRIDVADDGGLRSLGFDLDEESYIVWHRDGDTYRREDGNYPVTRQMRGIAGTITRSLYASLQQLDAPLALAAKMNDILGWDIDFSRDLRKGDTFGIIYEEVWKSGHLVRTGAILALEITNRGHTRRAFRFTDQDGRPGFYDPDGKNLQKQLMRAPLEYSRISSGFSNRRFHPVLKRWMPHHGVDYAAPTGTPVRAGGDGVILVAGSKKGNGRYIQIRHTNREYETFYLHLSRFAKGIRKGVQVTQGQVIGYVGATGYATGPHLDYRVKCGGHFVNPRTLKLPAAAPVAPELLDHYQALCAMYTTALVDLPAGPSSPELTAPATEPATWNGVAATVAELPSFVRAVQN